MHELSRNDIGLLSIICILSLLGQVLAPSSDDLIIGFMNSLIYASQGEVTKNIHELTYYKEFI
jgi:hypothetical protein